MSLQKATTDPELDELPKHLLRLRQTVETKELRYVYRVIRHTFSKLRRKLTSKLLTTFINQNYVDDVQKSRLLGYLAKLPEEPVVMEIEPTHPEAPSTTSIPNITVTSSTPSTSTSTSTPTHTPTPTPTPTVLTTPFPTPITTPTSTSVPDLNLVTSTPKELLPEVDVYLHLLVLLLLIDKKQYEEAVTCSTELVAKMESYNRRTLDPLSARVYFYYSRAYELTHRLAEIRNKLLAALCTATLRHNYEGQTTLLNLLLRNYLHYNLYDQAEKFVSKTEFKEDSASSNQLARYYYYQGRIKCVQLNYSDAYKYLQQALRKAPHHTANGFRATATKLLCLVQLLMGEIPERSVFRQKGIKNALKPYLELTQAVRRGNLEAYLQVLKNREELFKKDKTLTLIQRLRMSVIKTGLKRINTAYSRIHFKDICAKLKLPSPEDAEYIVAKAIRDGVIDGIINHEAGYLQSKESVDVYSTKEPQLAFNARIQFCLDIHNEAIKAMRYPPTTHKEVDEERLDREKQQEDLVKAIDEEDIGDDFF